MIIYACGASARGGAVSDLPRGCPVHGDSCRAVEQATPRLPKRDTPALIEALRIRALALTGQEWERNATRDMMNEAAQQLEELQAALDRAIDPPVAGSSGPPAPPREERA